MRGLIRIAPIGTMVAVSLLAVIPAAAQTVQAAKQSCTGNPDIGWGTQIKSCSVLIQAGSEGASLALNYYKRGIAHFNVGDWDKSIADNDSAIRINAKYADASVNRGASYARKGQIDRAIQDYDQAIRLDARDAIVFYNRGKAYLDRDQNDLAIQDFNQSLSLSANNAARAQQPRRGVPQQRQLRPRHSGFRLGNQRRRQISGGLQQPLLGTGARQPFREGAGRLRHISQTQA